MINRLIIIASILLAIAFSTLLERKILGLSQIRKGPALVGTEGLFQPFSDGLKLLSKVEIIWSNSIVILLAPGVIFSLIMIFWFPQTSGMVYMNLAALYLLAVGSVMGLFVLVVGWSGGRSYSLIGGLRAAAQMISYEVVLSFFFILYCSVDWSLNLFALKSLSICLIAPFFYTFILWIVVLLAETNRAPFDISEGESELVRGFNTEYSRILFTILFLMEYGVICAYGMLSSYFMLGGWRGGIIFISLILWLRSCFPRKRYDSLITLLWIYYFPLILIITLSWVLALIC